MKFKYKGVTLIELIIVVAVVAILGSIAYPSYQEHVTKTHRSESAANLLELSQFMEKFFSETGNYNFTATLPITQSPDIGNAKYTIAFAAGSPTTVAYAVVATPVGSQTSDTRCAALTLNSAGVKCVIGTTHCSNGSAADRQAVATCW